MNLSGVKGDREMLMQHGRNLKAPKDNQVAKTLQECHCNFSY